MIVLSPEDLIALTMKERPTAQAAELDFLNIPYRPRRDGSLVVLRIHVETLEAKRSGDKLPPEPTLVLDS